jgi:cation/acetate symporter
VTYWAARRTRSTREFYAAGRSVSPLQNGLALAGDYMSAASFLGITGLVALRGYDGMIYATGWLVGWPALMFLIAEPLRNLGKFTFADVVAFRLRQVPVRIAAAFGAILTLLFYVLAQMVGAGNLIALMFGLRYEWAVIGVGAVMLAYVLFGGMIATTWVQIIKAILLLFGVTLLTLLVLSRFGFSPDALYAAVAARYGHAALEPGGLVSDPVDAVSLGLALMFGLLGLPHILMRFYTVPDARAARTSVLYATGFIGYFYLIIPIVGFGASALVGRELVRKVDAGGNMAAPLVAELLGGTPFLGFIAAVAFATILAVVSGLALAGASAISHDIYAMVVKGGQANEQDEVRVSKIATLFLGVLAIMLGIIFENQNVAFMVGLAFAIAASCNFPVLVMSIFWKGLTTRGALIGGFLGLISAVVGVILSPAVWEVTFGFAKGSAPIRLDNPAIFSMALAFGGIWLFSILDRSTRAMTDRRGFDAQFVRSQTGIGAAGATAH